MHVAANGNACGGGDVNGASRGRGLPIAGGKGVICHAPCPIGELHRAVACFEVDGATAGDVATLACGGVGPKEAKVDVALGGGEAHIPPAPRAGSADIDHCLDGQAGREDDTSACFDDDIACIGRVGGGRVAIGHNRA